MEDLTNIRERLAKLETHVIQNKEDRTSIKETIEDQTKKIEGLDQTTHAILRKIERYEGKFGGVLLVVGTVVAFFTMFGKFILTNWEAFVAYTTKG